MAARRERAQFSHWRCVGRAAQAHLRSAEPPAVSGRWSTDDVPRPGRFGGRKFSAAPQAAKRNLIVRLGQTGRGNRAACRFARGNVGWPRYCSKPTSITRAAVAPTIVLAESGCIQPEAGHSDAPSAIPGHRPRATQRPRQHLLRNTANHAFEFIEASGLLNQHGDGHDRPLVTHAPEHLLACWHAGKVPG